MAAVNARKLLVAVLLGGILGGILGGWVAMAIGLVLLPLLVLAVQGVRRQLSH